METQMLTPTPGRDYPRTWNEFLDWFATEEACLTFLEKLRWPHGFICPRCGNTGDVYRASRTRLLGPLQLLAVNLTGIGLHPVQLEDTFCSVNGISRSSHTESPSQVVGRNCTVALNAVRCEAHPPIASGVGGVHTISLCGYAAPFEQPRRVS